MISAELLYDKGCSLFKLGIFSVRFYILRQDTGYLWNKRADSIEQVNRSKETNHFKKYHVIYGLIHSLSLSVNLANISCCNAHLCAGLPIKIYPKNVKKRLGLC